MDLDARELLQRFRQKYGRNPIQSFGGATGIGSPTDEFSTFAAQEKERQDQADQDEEARTAIDIANRGRTLSNQIEGQEGEYLQGAKGLLSSGQEYASQLADMEQRQNVLNQGALARDLKNEQNDIRFGANSRGLLYSGLKQAADAQAMGRYGAAVQDSQAKVRRQLLEDKFKALDPGREAIMTAGQYPIQGARRNQQSYAKSYQQGIGQTDRANQAISSLSSGIASGAGSVLAKRLYKEKE